MQDVNVVVLFYSRTGSTERLALAAAVGAVQGRANIRLRRLPDTADEATIGSVPGWRENRARMETEYVGPRDADIDWADAILAGMPADAELMPAEFERYFDALDPSRVRGKSAGKIGAPFTAGRGSDALDRAMRRAGFIALAVTPWHDEIVGARLQGRRAAEAARSLRAPASANRATGEV
jgi:multimeric flavodoxin WrbA